MVHYCNNLVLLRQAYAVVKERNDNLGRQIFNLKSELPLVMTTYEVSMLLRCSEEYVRRIAHEGRIPFLKNGKNMVFRKSDILNYLEEIFWRQLTTFWRQFLRAFGWLWFVLRNSGKKKKALKPRKIKVFKTFCVEETANINTIITPLGKKFTPLSQLKIE